MIKTFFHTHFTSFFLLLLSLVLVLDIGAPRAASFAAPVAGLLLMIAYVIGHGRFLNLRAAEFVLLAAVAALATLSALWAIDPAFAVERGGKIALIFLGGLFFIEAARQVTLRAIPACYVKILCVLYTLACTVIAAELFFGLPLYRFINAVPPEQPVYPVFMNRSLIVMTALYLPLLLLLKSFVPSRRLRLVLAVPMSVALGAGLVLTESQSAQMFFILALFFLLVFPVQWRAVWLALGGAIIALALVSPWLAQALYNAFPYDDPAMTEGGIMTAASIPHRLEVWNFVATEALKSPLYGQGIEAIRFIKSDVWLKLPNTDNMLHPHNAVLQIWVEFGVIGIVLASLFFAYVLRRLWAAPPLARRFGLATLIGMLAVMNTGYGLWQSWQLGLLITLAGLLALGSRAAETVDHPVRT